MSTEDALRRCAEANQRHQERIAELERIERQQSEWIDGLMVEQGRYVSENAALREIARAVAALKPQSIEADYYNAPLNVPCPFCGCDEGERHADDCPVTKARALLGLNLPASRTTPPQP